MRLPRTPLRRAGALAAAVAAAGVVALTISTQAGAHPGPEDSSGGHYCTRAQAASGLCAPPTYHRHDEGGNIRVVTPGPEAAQLASQPFEPGTTPTTAPAPVPGAPPPAAPAAAPLADTGPIDLRIAVLGSLLSAIGFVAMVANRRIPLPVILEFERPAAV